MDESPEWSPPSTDDPFSRKEPRSLFNLVTPEVQNAIQRAYQLRPDLFALDERHLLKKLKEEVMLPSVTDNRIRIRFWHEYDFAVESGTRMNFVGMLSRICHKSYFYGTYLQRAEKMAWLMCMPAAYENKIEEMLEFGLEQLRDILETDHFDAKQRPNIKLMELKAKIVALVEARKYGAIVQRVKQETTSLNVNVSDKQIEYAVTQGTMEDINKRIKMLEGQDRLAARDNERAQIEREAKDGESGAKGRPSDIVIPAASDRSGE